MPRTGTATFSTGVTGLQETEYGLAQFNGSGLFSFSFGGWSWNGKGATIARLPLSREPIDSKQDSLLVVGHFSGFGQISSGGNRFQGSLTLTSGYQYSGSLDGRFYGPAAEEIGATFSGTDSIGKQMTGTLTGRLGTAAEKFETLQNLFGRTPLPELEIALSYTRNADGTYSDARLRSPGYSSSAVVIDPETDTMEFGFATLSPENRVTEESDSRFSTYHVSPDTAGPRTYRVLNSSGSNDQLALTYTNLALETIGPKDSPSVDTARVYGIPSHFTALPRTGTGVYNGVLYGTAIGSGEKADRFLLSGTAGLTFDWAGNVFTGTLVPVAANERTGENFALGTYSLINGSFAGVTGSSTYFESDIGGVDATTGRLNGRFYGPAAEEIGAVFSLTTPGAGTVLIGSGAIVGTR
ncbi:transferrin-binding protein-like solute binding protein [Altericroceibacterium xinjiangense]|uniref:transferrin-binding protein-like solute binding protein n=1 Tax=Altericroceibacterium xinjiangense TaxID=762261 RepID=UPI000F7FA4B4|nr:transferrin-binding protein-like solute binding protein [Altericroceibacterium xinjiangense]